MVLLHVQRHMADCRPADMQIKRPNSSNKQCTKSFMFAGHHRHMYSRHGVGLPARIPFNVLMALAYLSQDGRLYGQQEGCQGQLCYCSHRLHRRHQRGIGLNCGPAAPSSHTSSSGLQHQASVPGGSSHQTPGQLHVLGPAIQQGQSSMPIPCIAPPAF